MEITMSCGVFLLVCYAVVATISAESVNKEYCIVGAGPSGLQLGSFLSIAKRDYVIFDKGSIAGNFFVKYPRHGKLISINKRHTGKTNDEFNMRHDWNSLITDELSLRMTKYSKEFFPPKQTMVDYLNDFRRHYNIPVIYNTTVTSVTPPSEKGGQFQIEDQHHNVHQCKVVIMATGYSKENIQTFPGSEYTIQYGEMTLDLDDFEGKSVLILGRGNSAFETADHILGSTNLVHMMGRSRVKLSWETHYVGDLRAVNNGLLDTYQLKSLDALLEAPVSVMNIIKLEDGRFRLNISEDLMKFDNFAMRDDYDIVINCLGFKYDFSVFNQTGAHPKPHADFDKFPSIRHNYESDTVDDIFFAGTSTHSLDFRKSAGGFIHGFRYTTRSLFHLLEWRYQAVKWPSVTLPWTDMLNTITKRINEASGTYQMFGVLGDIILIDDEKQQFTQIDEFPIQLIHDIERYTGHKANRFIVSLSEYGKDFSGPGNDIFRESRATGEPSEAHISNFLHPTFYYYKSPPTEAEMLDVKHPEILPTPDRLHHIVEDFLTEFDAPVSHILPTRRYLETCLGTDLRSYLDEECFEFALTHQTLPVDCQIRYMNNEPLTLMS